MSGFRRVTGQNDQVAVLVRGAVGTTDVDRGRHLAAAIGQAPGAGQRQIKMAEYRQRTGASVAVAQINVHYACRLVRSQATGPTLGEAVGTAGATLSRRLDRLARRLNEIPAGPPDFAGEAWDRRASRNIPPPWRLAGPGRRIVRQKAVALALQDTDAAALTMDLRDYDFHLFAEATLGEHALVHRCGSGYRLRLPRPELLRGVTFAAPVTLDETPLPRLSLAEAVHRLDRDQVPFVGFLAATTGHGTVLYRRYDGHLGIVTSLW